MVRIHNVPDKVTVPQYTKVTVPQYTKVTRLTKYQQDAACNRIYYTKVYWRLNMFRAAHRSSSGALNCICSLWFTYCNKVKDFVYIIHSPYYNITIVIDNITIVINILIWTMYNIYGIFYFVAVCKPEAANTVESSWWWAVCRSKHVEPSVNFGIINFITSCILLVFLRK